MTVLRLNNMFNTCSLCLCTFQSDIVYKIIVLHTLISHIYISQCICTTQNTHCARNTDKHLLCSRLQSGSSALHSRPDKHLIGCIYTSSVVVSVGSAQSQHHQEQTVFEFKELPQPSFNMQIYTVLQKDVIGGEALSHLNISVSQSPVFYWVQL